MAKRASRRGQQEASLNITSMMDMMTIILVFLLKSYSTDDIAAGPSDDLVLPVSSSVKPPKLAVNVIVGKTKVVVDGEEVLELEQDVDENGQPTWRIPDDLKVGPVIGPLADVLENKAQTAKNIGQRTGNDEFDFKGEVLLQCDKNLPFQVIREVMFTAGQQQFGQFRFVVIKGSG